MNCRAMIVQRMVLAAGLLGAEGVVRAEDPIAQPELTRERSAWTIGVSASPQWFFGTRTDWLDEQLWVKRQWAGLSVALGYSHIARYGLWDDGVWTDTYFSLWPQAYGNVLVTVTPESRVTPRWDAAAEVFQGVGNGWEAAVRVRRMSFPANGVWLVTPAAAWYVGEWFLRARLTVVSPSALDLSWSLQARRYLGNEETYVEATAGLGVGEVVSVTAAGSTALAWSKSLMVRFQTPVRPWGDVGLWTGVQDESSLGFSVTMGVELRWRP